MCEGKSLSPENLEFGGGMLDDFLSSGGTSRDLLLTS